VIWTNPAEAALTELTRAPLVRFSLLALSSIFFLVDPFAAIPSFLAITESAEPIRRKRMARKAAITCFIVLTSFALGGQLIFRMFGITLPAFEVAGGLILLLIGLDMLQAKRSPTQEASGDTEEAAAKEDAGGHCGDGAGELLGTGRGGARSAGDGRDRDSHPGAHYGPSAGGAGHAVLCQWTHGLGTDFEAIAAQFPTESPAFHRQAACILGGGLLFSESCREVTRAQPDTNLRTACNKGWRVLLLKSCK